jgi:hypothetical protein
MNPKLKPFLIVGGFWFLLFLFVMAGYSGDFGSAVTGYAIYNKDGSASPMGLQSVIILVLFFTNLISMFFLVREMTKDK